MKTKYSQQPGTESNRLNLKVSAALKQAMPGKSCAASPFFIKGNQVFDEIRLLDCLVVPRQPPKLRKREGGTGEGASPAMKTKYSQHTGTESKC